MPRPFSNVERETIRQRLMGAARDSIARLGIRRTAVADLARVAGISKGAFYLFFPTKEALVLEALASVEAQVRAELSRHLQEPWQTVHELLTRFLAFQSEVLDRHPILRVLTDPNEAAVLLRTIPPEDLAERMADEQGFYAAMFADWQARGWVRKIDLAVLAGLPRLAMAMSLQREFLGEERYAALRDLLVEALGAWIAAEGHGS